MDLSIIVVNYNTKALLDQCLKSVFKFTNGIRFEVIVVDNNSEDKSQELLKKKYPQVKLILNRQNLGFSKANNQGIKEARGDYIFLLNSDTYLIENSFEKLLTNIKSRSKLGAIAPQLLNENRSIQQSAGFFPNLSQVFYWMTFLDDLPGGTILKPYHIDHESFYKNGHEVDWLTAAAILVPKSVIDKVSTFDQHIFMYGEEVEWCYRIKKGGFKIYFSPVTKVIHIGRGSSKKTLTKAIIGEYQGLIYFYKKHKNNFSLQILKVLLKIGALLRIAVFSAVGKNELANSYKQALKVV